MGVVFALLGASAGHRGGAARGAAHGAPLLIEATCNQVNQFGGYTGMTPADFRRFVRDIAAARRLRRAARRGSAAIISVRMPGATEPAEVAMAKAEVMVARVRGGRLSQDPSRLLDGLRG